MAPPFYSKNGSANRYSRMGEILLRRHFAAVWPTNGEARFEEWWAHSEAHGLCYSFECVVPRILGDHGATPDAAYMVLTMISHVGGGGSFLSPAQLLRLATDWRLPVNEVRPLHQHRTTRVLPRTPHKYKPVRPMAPFHCAGAAPIRTAHALRRR